MVSIRLVPLEAVTDAMTQVPKPFLHFLLMARRALAAPESLLTFSISLVTVLCGLSVSECKPGSSPQALGFSCP